MLGPSAPTIVAWGPSGRWVPTVGGATGTPPPALTLRLPPGIPLVYSGGFDGTVRAWGPGADPLASLSHRGRAR